MYKTTKREAVAVVWSCASCSLPSHEGVSEFGLKRMSIRQREFQSGNQYQSDNMLRVFAVGRELAGIKTSMWRGMGPELESHLCARAPPQENRVNGMVEPARTRSSWEVR